MTSDFFFFFLFFSGSDVRLEDSESRDAGTVSFGVELGRSETKFPLTLAGDVVLEISLVDGTDALSILPADIDGVEVPKFFAVRVIVLSLRLKRSSMT